MNGTVKFTLATLMLFVITCKEEDCNSDCDSAETPIATFEYSRFRCNDSSNNCVQFQNISENITEKSIYLWTFGDGESSDNENPVHKFNDYGDFNVVLRVTNCNGNTSFYSETINISFD
jgi:PKD repeat protein